MPFEAGVAQLVEHHLAKVDVVGSNPITRSNFPLGFLLPLPRYIFPLIAVCADTVSLQPQHGQSSRRFTPMTRTDMLNAS